MTPPCGEPTTIDGKARYCERAQGHTGRHMAQSCGRRRYWRGREGKGGVSMTTDTQTAPQAGCVTLRVEPVNPATAATGAVAYLRMPLPLSSMRDMRRFVEQAYGKGCVATEEPKGWLKISNGEE